MNEIIIPYKNASLKNIAEKIEAVLESARQTIGLPCAAAERDYLMALGAETACRLNPRILADALTEAAIIVTFQCSR